jgi:hypothetical protein
VNVADLQQHLADLQRLLEAAGAKGAVLADLSAIGNGLRPFRQHSLKDFADFLVRAEAFSRGEVPVVPEKKPRKVTPAPRSKEKTPDPATMAEEAKRVYAQAPNPSFTVDTLDELAGRLEKLNKDGLLTVAAALELKFNKSATKPKILQEIRNLIVDRKGSTDRSGLLERPTTPIRPLGLSDERHTLPFAPLPGPE